MVIITDFVDFNKGILELPDSDNNLMVNPPSIFLDLEMIELSRTGSIPSFRHVFTLMTAPYFIDVYSDLSNNIDALYFQL